jgi:hypothetical protein
MGKLEQEAKHVTAGNLERGGRFGLWRTGRLGSILGGQWSDFLSGCSSCNCLACYGFSSTAPVSC